MYNFGRQPWDQKRRFSREEAARLLCENFERELERRRD